MRLLGNVLIDISGIIEDIIGISSVGMWNPHIRLFIARKWAREKWF